MQPVAKSVKKASFSHRKLLRTVSFVTRLSMRITLTAVKISVTVEQLTTNRLISVMFVLLQHSRNILQQFAKTVLVPLMHLVLVQHRAFNVLQMLNV